MCARNTGGRAQGAVAAWVLKEARVGRHWGGSPESIKDLCHTLALALVTSLIVASASRRAQAYFSLPLPTSWTLSLVAVRADGGGLMAWSRAAANAVALGRELTSVQEHLCPCQV